MDLDTIIASDYELYRAWFDRSLDVIWQLSPDMRRHADPMIAIEKAEKSSRARAVRSLRTGIKDTLAVTDRFTNNDIASFDETFRSAGLPLLSTLRALFSNQIRKVLDRQSVASDEEYYLLRSLDDADIPDEIRKSLAEMIAKYESLHAGNTSRN